LGMAMQGRDKEGVRDQRGAWMKSGTACPAGGQGKTKGGEKIRTHKDLLGKKKIMALGKKGPF